MSTPVPIARSLRRACAARRTAGSFSFNLLTRARDFLDEGAASTKRSRDTSRLPFWVPPFCGLAIETGATGDDAVVKLDADSACPRNPIRVAAEQCMLAALDIELENADPVDRELLH